MANLGLDPAAVRNLASLLMAKADEIESISSLLTSQLASVWWEGADANSFRSDWESTRRVQLTHVANALRDASRAATANVIQQEQASGS